MRVLLLITDLLIGGSPTVVRELSLRLREKGVDVQVACLSGWGPTADQIAARGIKVTALNARGSADIGVFFRLRRLLRQERIDVVFSFLIHANTAAAVARLLGSSVRLFQSIQTTQPQPRWHWRLQSLIQSSAERIVVPSPSVAAVARERCSIPDARLVVIPNAIDPAEFVLPHRRPAEAGRCRIGFIGRLDPIKRVEDLIAAVRVLPDLCDLHIYGSGEHEPKLRTFARPLAGRCIFHGPIDRPQAALSEIDVLVLPSDAEGFGLVLIEAMAAGVPVIATDVPGIRDVVTDGVNGLLVPARAPGHLARAIELIAKEPDLGVRLISAGRQSVVERFSWDAAIAAYLRLLQV